MSRLMKSVKLGVLAAVAVSGVALTTATPASAAVACNRYNECWHTNTRYTTYPANLGVKFYDDAWRAGHAKHYHWRAEPKDDHGYYSHGHWRNF